MNRAEAVLKQARPGCLLRVASALICAEWLSVGMLPGQAPPNAAPQTSPPSDSPSLSILRQSIEVKADAGDAALDGSLSGTHLRAADIQNRSTSLTNDPLRSMQLLPGVVANDDLKSSFMVRGADSYRVGVYLDGVLLHAPYHRTEEGPGQASLSTVPGQLLESATFFGGNHPIRLSDTSAGAVELRTRDGDRSEMHTSFELTMVEAALTAEGGFGPKHNGSWLFTVRQSYMNYLVQGISGEQSALFGYRDFAGKLSYDLSPRHNLSLLLMAGHSGLDLGSAATEPGSVASSAYGSGLASLAWRYIANSRLMVTSRIAEQSDSVRNDERTGIPLVRERTRWRSVNETATWVVSSWDTVDAGLQLRQEWTSGLNPRVSNDPFPRQTPAAATQSSGYVRNLAHLLDGRLTLDLGARWNVHSGGERAVACLHGASGFRVWRSGSLHAGWAQYAQFPDFEKMIGFSLLSLPVRPERSSHFDVGFDQKLGIRNRLNVTFYRRRDRDLLPELSSVSFLSPALQYGTRGEARGIEVSLTAGIRRLTIVTAYAGSASIVRPAGAGVPAPSDADQRHTVSAYLHCALRPSLRFSVKWRYGSGLPVPGAFEERGGQVYIGGLPNQLRMDSYNRLDARADKSWRVGRVQLTLHAEVLNLLNHLNRQFAGAAYTDKNTGAVEMNFARTLPLLPTAGLNWRF